VTINTVTTNAYRLLHVFIYGHLSSVSIGIIMTTVFPV